MTNKGLAPAPWTGDHALVNSVLRGDLRAWHALVDKYSQLVYAVILRYGVNADDASDLFQTVWVNVYSDLEKVRKHDSLRSWLITATRRRCYRWRQELLGHGRLVRQSGPQSQQKASPPARTSPSHRSDAQEGPVPAPYAQRAVLFHSCVTALDLLACLMPERIATEDIGDAVEDLYRRIGSGQPAWRIRLKLMTTAFWIGINAIREVVSALKGKPRIS